MPSLDELRLALSLRPHGQSPGPDHSPDFGTLEEALALLPGTSPALVRPAALRLLALEMLGHLPGVTSLLGTLHATLAGTKPERELVQWLAQLTRGRAEELLDGDLSEPAFVARLYLALNTDADARSRDLG